MANYEIPLSPEAQTFDIALAGVVYSVTLYWGTRTNAWLIDLASESGTPILTGIPMVANVDLLSPFPYLNFGGQLIAQTDNLPNIPPTYDNLGLSGHLYFVTTP